MLLIWKNFPYCFFYLHFKLHIVFKLRIVNNVLENYWYLFHFSYSVLTDQQSQVQATKCIINEQLLNYYYSIANSS